MEIGIGVQSVLNYTFLPLGLVPLYHPLPQPFHPTIPQRKIDIYRSTK